MACKYQHLKYVNIPTITHQSYSVFNVGIAVLKIDYTKPLNTTDAFFPYYYITDNYSQSLSTQGYQHTHYPQCSGFIFCLQHLH